jgi:hypothetical protein
LRRNLRDIPSAAARRRFKAKCRTTAMLRAPKPLRRRDWSFLKVTSRTQCTRYSMPQWPRTAWAARAASSAAEEM